MAFGIPPQKVPFTISKNLNLTFRSENKGVVQCSEFIDSPVKYSFKRSESDVVPLPTASAYNGKVPIKKPKIDDVRKIIQYIPDEHKAFYEERLTWPTTDVETANDDWNVY